MSVVWIDSDFLNEKVKGRLEKNEWIKIQKIISKNDPSSIYKNMPKEKQYSRFSKKNLNSTTSQLPIDDLDFYYDQINWRTIRDMLKRAEQPSEYIINGYIHLIRCALYVEDMTSRGIIPQFDPLNRESILNGLHLLEIVPKVMVFQDAKDSLKSQDWLERLGFALHPSSKPYHLKILSVDSDIDVSNAALWRLSNKL